MTRALALAALACLSCSASPATPVAPSPPPPAAVAPAPLGPARYVYTDRVGVLFDEAGGGSSLPRAEPAIVDGVRLVLDHGVVVAAAREAERWTGFRSLPARLGGGYALWSADRTYLAADFLGALRPLADLGSPGGARPFLRSFLLRTESGVCEIEPGSLALHRSDVPGLADAIALDDRRAARLDALGRASFTADGGATWTDVARTRGALVQGLSLRDQGGGEVVLVTDDKQSLVLGAKGDLRAEVPAARPAGDPSPVPQPLAALVPASSRALPAELFANAIAHGALLAGGRALVAREGGLRAFSIETALPVADVDLALVDEKLAHCQALSLGPEALVACSGDAGSELLALRGSLARPALEATFPGTGIFLAGPGGRLAFDGRCGPDPPSSADLGPGAVKRAEPSDDDPDAASAPPEEPPAIEPPPDDDARACVRAGPSRWIERRLRGEGARRFYRWVPGRDGTVTALLLGGSSADAGAGGGSIDAGTTTTAGEGVRVLEVDQDDPALAGGSFPAASGPSTEPPYRTVNTDFWEDDDGSIRGWIHLPAEGEAAPEPTAQGPTKRMLRVASERGGKLAGLRIDAAGHVTVLPLPESTTQVVTGGRFGLATAQKDGVDTWFETLDGGASWTPVEGPPSGSIDAPADDHTPFACSAMGCTWGSGVVRLGWGGPRAAPPAPAAEPAPAARLPFRAPQPLRLVCHADTDREPRAGKAVIALGARATSLGAIGDRGWTGDVSLPFQPGAATRHLSVSDRQLTETTGYAIPVLAASARDPVDLLLILGKRRLRAGSAERAFVPFELAGHASIAADAPGGLLVTLDAERAVLGITRGGATAEAAHLVRVAQVTRTRLTLGRRMDGGLSVVGYSTSSGEVFAGEVDLARAEVGPLAGLGRLETMAPASACGDGKPVLRFLAELPAQLVVIGKGGKQLANEGVTATALVAAGRERLCVEGVEVPAPRGKGFGVSASLARGGRGVVRMGDEAVGAVCAIERAP